MLSSTRATGLALVLASVFCPHFGFVRPLDGRTDGAARLNPAAQQPSQQKNQGRGGGGSVSAGLGATDLHGLNDYNGCMAQTSGAQEKLAVQALERRLA